MRAVMLIFLCLVGCGPQSVEDCHKQGQHIVSALADELEAVQSAADAKKRLNRLSSLYFDLSELMVMADTLEQDPDFVPDTAAGERLRRELIRVYAIPGASQWVEEAQDKALRHLSDSYAAKQDSRSDQDPIFPS